MDEGGNEWKLSEKSRIDNLKTLFYLNKKYQLEPLVKKLYPSNFDIDITILSFTFYPLIYECSISF